MKADIRHELPILVGMALAIAALSRVLPDEPSTGRSVIIGVSVFAFGVILSRARKRPSNDS